ncbi:hypothetical protein [Nostoc sp. UHCC 0251]|uniref:hypothetical protein n=1 Tax=Nostoc sp. UHCC 0251 TaxID=3110240 RepID=UPI002B205FB6|nr:hypothetical protein [Nostoc sp. UHCC 0251]MEA5623490.1 hypothetical protein [Nostoc sp. UHCC 0251]
MRWKQLTIMFISTIVFLFTGNAIAQTDLNINNANLVRLGGNVTVVEKQVVENAIAIGGSAIIQPNGRVTKTAIAIGGNVILNQGARVDGDAYAIGGQVVQAEGATIGGSKGIFDDQYNERGMMGMHRDRNRFFPMYFFHASFRILSAIVAAIVGIILLQTAPRFLPNLAATVRQYPGQSALWGIGAVFTLIVLNIFLALTLIGIPLIPLVSLIVSLTSLVGALGISLFIGQQVVKSDRRSSLQQFLIGLLIVTILALIPFFGGIVVSVVSLLGLGSILAWKLGKAQPPILE